MQSSRQVADSELTTAPSKLWERNAVLAICTLAAVHIAAFSLAFPPANNVDEYLHFDLAIRYSHGEIPTQVFPVSDEAMSYVARYATWEYTCVPVTFPGQKYPPPFWTLPADKAAEMIATNTLAWQRPNYEDSQPPLYYLIAGFWWQLGHWLGLEMGNLYYWLRLLDIFIVVAVIVVAYLTAHFIFSENAFLRLGVPALIAFMPQSEFYSIDNDVLSPLCFGLTLFFLLKWLKDSSVASGIGLGLAFAATYLAKVTNLPLLAVVGTVIVLKAVQSSREGKWAAFSPSLAGILCCAVPPTVLWILWCKSRYGYTLGDLNVLYAGWRIKPFTRWWHHPIYSPSGLWTYLCGQLGTFWQGEFWWHGQQRRLCLHGTDAIYTALSLAFLSAAAPSVFSRIPKATPDGPLLCLRIALACVLVELAFFAAMSVVYEFTPLSNPPSWHPFFREGRLLLGFLIPFLLLIVYGLDRLLNRFGTGAKFVTLTAIILAMLTLEVTTDWPVFFSQYNWFHLP